MEEQGYTASAGHLRSPQRIAMLEIDRVVTLTLEGIQASSVLDVATGSGIFAEAFERRGLLAAGIDANTELLKIAQQFSKTGVFLEGTIEQIPLKDRAVDVVFLAHVLHKTGDISSAIRECKRVARKRIAILEWPYQLEEDGPPLEQRLKTDDVIAATEQIGFSQVEAQQLKRMILFKLTL